MRYDTHHEEDDGDVAGRRRGACPARGTTARSLRRADCSRGGGARAFDARAGGSARLLRSRRGWARRRIGARRRVRATRRSAPPLVLVVDAGPLVAAAATRARNHERCAALLSQPLRPLLVPSLVVTEVAYFLADRIGPHAETAFARSLREGELLIEPVEPGDLVRIDDLVEEYADLPLGIVDASVVASCERLG